MKNYIYLLMVMLLSLLTVGFAACGDDDEPKVADIVGTWQYDHPDDEDAAVDYDLFYQFTKDGKFHIVTKYYETYYGRPNFVVYHGTYTVSGNKLKVTYDNRDPNDPEPAESEYSVRGDKLMFLDGDEPTFTRVEDSVIEPYLKY